VPLAAQSYGVGDQTLVLGALSFVGESDPGSIGGDGFLYQSGFALFDAPVDLPDGAEVTQICLYSTNQKPGATLSIWLEAVKLPPGGAAPGGVAIPGTSVTATSSSGYGYVCTDPISYTFHDIADIDGDGAPDNVAHRIEAIFSEVNDGTLALGAARVTWHRQIASPPSTPTFGDVPAGNPFFQYVEALSASAITGGCNAAPPQFCPSSPLTRGQMSVFLAKALGLHWPD
jgi:hypothetical protein